MKFNEKKFQKLDNPKRKEILPANKIIKSLKISDYQAVADIGCGVGYFTLPMAQEIGSQGTVFAVDISEIMVNETKRRVDEENLKNVQVIRSQENSFGLSSDSIDLIFISTVFHELKEPIRFLLECKKVLKEEGILIILDWDKIEDQVGPPIHKRIDQQLVEEYALETGFEIIKKEDISGHFYMVTCKKTDTGQERLIE